MRIGYARVSTCDQNVALQVDALRRAGCDRIFEDHGISGVSAERPGLHEALDSLKAGDTFVVWRLDRLARSMRDLTDMVTGLHEQDIEFLSLCEYVNVTTAFGEFALHILAAAAHLERALIIERTREGMAAAKARGAIFGRKPVLNDEALHEALHMIENGISVTAAAQQLCVGRSTLYRYLAAVDTSGKSYARECS
ncbi:MAG: recombinase family protein [Sneathiella sp.]|nr:recombinase family protein [Sneathiella sp.]